MQIYIIIFIILIEQMPLSAQSNYTVSGIVRDERTKEVIIGTKISVPSLSIGVITNKEGYYSLKIPEGTHTMKILSYGYKLKVDTIQIETDIIQHIELQEQVFEKEAIIVTDKKPDENVKSTSVGKVTLTLDQLRNFSSVYAEIDIIRSFLNTHGVSTSNDFITGFNVRGGSVDQNLVLLDDMVLFNPFHAFGFFSSFNPDALKSATLYKTNIPIELGGRASSALDVTQKKGRNDQYSTIVTITGINAKIMIEGPLGTDKGSFMIAARRSYFDIYLNFLKNLDPNLAKNYIISITDLYFYDINAKLSYSFDKYNELSLSFYTGKDVVSFTQDLYNDKTYIDNIDKKYGNIAGSLNWKHIFSEGFFSNLILSVTDYSIDSKGLLEIKDSKYDKNSPPKLLSIDTTRQSYSLLQEIINIGLKYNATYLINNDILLKFGTEGIGFALIPGLSTTSLKKQNNPEVVSKTQYQNRYFTEWSLYAGIEQNILPQLKVDYGIRGQLYIGLGPLNVNQYQNNTPIEYDKYGFATQGMKIGETSFKNLEIANYHIGIEPRISGRYLLDEETSIKAGYSWLRQNIQLTTSFSYLTFPVDTWYISDKYIQPQTSHNVTLGVYRNFLDNELEISIEGYFRLLQNLNDYIEGYNPFSNTFTNVEQFIYQADGRAYGLEIYIVKNKGKRNYWTDNLTGSISYTFSRTERRHPAQVLAALPIAISEYYALGYDKTHNFNISLGYEIHDWIFSILFVYQTNIPKNVPLAVFMNINALNIGFYNYYGHTLNSYRLADYHRLDISIRKNFHINIPEINRTFDIGLILSASNIYNRINSALASFSLNKKTNIYEYKESGFIPMSIDIGVEFKL